MVGMSMVCKTLRTTAGTCAFARTCGVLGCSQRSMSTCCGTTPNTPLPDLEDLLNGSINKQGNAENSTNLRTRPLGNQHRRGGQRRARDLQGFQAKQGFSTVLTSTTQPKPEQPLQRFTSAAPANVSHNSPMAPVQCNSTGNSGNRVACVNQVKARGTANAAINDTFYRRPLPDSEGRKLFAEALAQGGLDGSYWDLSENFVTQSEPASCATGTLAMVLNSLAVDPQQQWKGVWRWYFDEKQLDCCGPGAESFSNQGMTFSEMACCARCNGVHVSNFMPGQHNICEDHFRSAIQDATMRPDGNTDSSRMVVSFSRATLGQTGSGHFSPIGAYHPEEDKALIMDVARFKYHPFWVDVSLLWEATKEIDPSTGQSRGYMLMRRDNSEIPIKGNAANGELSFFRLCWGDLIQQYLGRASKVDEGPHAMPQASFGDKLHHALHGEALAQALKVRGNACRAGILWQLIGELSSTSTFKFVSSALGSGCSKTHEHTQHEVAVATALLLAAGQAPDRMLPLHPLHISELGEIVGRDMNTLSEAMQGEIIKVRDQMLILSGRRTSLM